MDQNNISNSNSESSQVPPIVAAEYLENNVVSYNFFFNLLAFIC